MATSPGDPGTQGAMACKDYLVALNAEQRSAVEHGVTAAGPNIAPPFTWP
jgi:hypothetical protein